MKYSPIALSVMLSTTVSIASFGSVAQEPIEQRKDQEIEKVTVTSSRVERDINEVASKITVIDSQQIDRLTATDIRDLVRYEPGVVVEGGGRFGLSGFNIRGINGDRILTLLDGAPIADEFSFGPALSARRDFVDVDLVSRVEIIRGPASTLYGSDAIGGVVAFSTKTVKDILGEGQTLGGRVKTGYTSVSDEFVINTQVAGINGDWSWLANVTHRNGAETTTFYDDDGALGDARIAANPQSNESNAAQIKLAYSPSKFHRFELLADYLRADSDTDVLSQATRVVRGTVINSSTGIDERSRERLQLNYSFSGNTLAFDKAQVRLYWQGSETVQQTFDERFGAISRTNPVPVLQDRERLSQFDQTVKGGIFQFDKVFTSGGADHYLIYGTELQYTDSEAIRNGSTRLQESGAPLPEFTAFPARDFPISDARELSFFVHDEISLLNDKLVLSPGVRFDKFTLTPRPDDIFINANPGVETVGFDDSQVSFKMGAVHNFNTNTNAWVQFAQGFRIPPYDDLNVGFTNLVGGYTSRANPDLLPESVDSWEIGFRQTLSSVSYSISAYHNNYDNFIESLASLGFDPALGLLVFQARNRESVTIKGVDAEATWYAGDVFDALQGWRLQTALTWLDSEDNTTGQDVESIIPPQAVVGLAYENEAQGWSAEVVATFVERFDQQNNPDLIAAPGYAQVDFLAHYDINKAVKINVGVFNVFDKEIVNGTEVRGLPADADVRFFTQPGRNFAINASYAF
jgi:hemoglobin/transferrin/lactoferrin receptor protein